MDDSTRECRRDVAARGLTPDAVAHLTRGRSAASSSIICAGEETAQAVLLRCAVDTSDDDALADLVGSGNGWWRYDLDDTFNFAFGWRDGAFRLGLARLMKPARRPTKPRRARAADPRRNLRRVGRARGDTEPPDDPFHHGPHPQRTEPVVRVRGAGRRSRVARLFSEFDDVANVLVGPDFVAVGIQRPDRWEQLLAPMLRLIEAEFPAASAESTTTPAPPTMHGHGRRSTYGGRRATSGNALDRAWRELRGLKLEQAARLGPPACGRVVTRRLDPAGRGSRLIDADGDIAVGPGAICSSTPAEPCGERPSTRWSTPIGPHSVRCSSVRSGIPMRGRDGRRSAGSSNSGASPVVMR